MGGSARGLCRPPASADGNEFRSTESVSRTSRCLNQTTTMDDNCTREKRIKTMSGIAPPM
ncbi:hypothetical protein KIN20_006793 [Parelaphostrongylus tenuis]|uniref:Uncharacterized protein n=1 Tax=Parelaphostrongylus tenuis TaxID=148309 RepID=A0AAD5M2A0_PARTN|nr:hypothetical protein KIN20_006793 [Parelaphostrongylus tenuis]